MRVMKPLFAALSVFLLTGSSAFAAEGSLISPAVYEFMVFVIAVFVGYYVVWSVTPALHTPLMSVTNAISGIIVVGAMVQITADDPVVRVLSAAAVLVASINVFGGFAVTRRMLAMFQKGGDK